MKKGLLGKYWGSLIHNLYIMNYNIACLLKYMISSLEGITLLYLLQVSYSAHIHLGLLSVMKVIIVYALNPA